MLQDKYGRLIIIGVFVLIGIVLIMAPGMNSKSKTAANDQLNFTSMPKEVPNIGEVENPEQAHQNVMESNELSQQYSSSSPEDQMLDAWGMRKPNVTEPSSQSPEILPPDQQNPNHHQEIVNPIQQRLNAPAENNNVESSAPVQAPETPKTPEPPKPKKHILKVNGKCFAPPIVNIPMTKSECEKNGTRFGIQACSKDEMAKDGWAGAVRACGGIEKMPDMDDLLAISRMIYGKDNLVIEQANKRKYRAFGTYTTDKNIECDFFAFNNLSYDSKIAQELGFPRGGGFEIWGKTEINPKYALSLLFGETSLKYNSCSDKNMQTIYSMCEIECK